MPTLRTPTPPLASGGIILRGLRGNDLPQITAACQDPEIQRWTRVPSPYSEADARGWIAQMRAREKAGKALELAIADSTSGMLVGAIGIVTVDWPNRRGEIGYWVAPQVRERGVAKIALTLLSDWALGPLGLQRTELKITPENTHSAAVARACGYELEGTLRNYKIENGQAQDINIFSLLSADVKAKHTVPRRMELGGGTMPAAH